QIKGRQGHVPLYWRGRKRFSFYTFAHSGPTPAATRGEPPTLTHGRIADDPRPGSDGLPAHAAPPLAAGRAAVGRHHGVDPGGLHAGAVGPGLGRPEPC